MPIREELPIGQLSKLIRPEDLAAHDVNQGRVSAQINAARNEALDIDIDQASDDQLRDVVRLLLRERNTRIKEEVRPVGIDHSSGKEYEGLPVYFEGRECPLCSQFGTRPDPISGKDRPVCHDCNETIPYYEEHAGHGLESYTVK